MSLFIYGRKLLFKLELVIWFPECYSANMGLTRGSQIFVISVIFIIYSLTTNHPKLHILLDERTVLYYRLKAQMNLLLYMFKRILSWEDQSIQIKNDVGVESDDYYGIMFIYVLSFVSSLFLIFRFTEFLNLFWTFTFKSYSCWMAQWLSQQFFHSLAK